MQEHLQQAKKYSDFLSIKRYIDTSYSIPLFSGLIVLTSACMVPKLISQSQLAVFKKAIRQTQSIKLIAERNLQNKLVYAQGKIIKSKEVLAQDNILNMNSSSNIDNLGLYRKVEVFKKKMFKKENESWFNINMLADTQRLNFHTELRSQVITNGTITVENHKLTNPLLLQLANENSQKKALDTQSIQDFFQTLEANKLNQNIYDSLSHYGPISTNPLFKLTQEGKHFSLKDDYIYIQTSLDRISNGDIRISFHDVSRIAEVTLLAAKNGNLYQQYEDQEIYLKKMEIQYNKNGKTVNANISLFNFITSGHLEKEELIQTLIAASNKNFNRDILLYSLVIFSLYFYVHTYLLIPFETEKEEHNIVRRKEIAKTIVEQTEISNVTYDDESLKRNLKRSLAFTCFNIGLIKTLTMGYVFSSSWVGFCVLLAYSMSVSSSLKMEKHLKEHIKELQKQKTEEPTQMASTTLKIMTLLNN